MENKVTRATIERQLESVIADMLDMQVKQSEDADKACGVQYEELKYKYQKNRAFKALAYASRQYLTWANSGDISKLKPFIGFKADMFLALLLLVMDRCESNQDILQAYELIESHMPSKKELDLNKSKSTAFEL